MHTPILHKVLANIASAIETAGEYHSTAVTCAVYDNDYTDLGSLVGELYQYWDRFDFGGTWGPSEPFRFADCDYCNGFEEFVTVLVEHWAGNVGLMADYKIDLQRLQELIAETKPETEFGPCAVCGCELDSRSLLCPRCEAR